MAYGSVDDEPIIFSTRTRVRMRQSYSSWVEWNDHFKGGPWLIIRSSAIEVRAHQGMMLASRHIVMQIGQTWMWRERLGFGGLPFGYRDCIVLASVTNVGPAWVGLTPLAGLDETWTALHQAGVPGLIGRPKMSRWQLFTLRPPL